MADLTMNEQLCEEYGVLNGGMGTKVIDGRRVFPAFDEFQHDSIIVEYSTDGKTWELFSTCNGGMSIDMLMREAADLKMRRPNADVRLTFPSAS